MATSTLIFPIVSCYDAHVISIKLVSKALRPSWNAQNVHNGERGQATNATKSEVECNQPKYFGGSMPNWRGCDRQLQIPHPQQRVDWKSAQHNIPSLHFPPNKISRLHKKWGDCTYYVHFELLKIGMWWGFEKKMKFPWTCQQVQWQQYEG